MRKFKIGDIIRGISDSYGITNTDMTKGEVIEIESDEEIRVKILEHKYIDNIGKDFGVKEIDFELVKGVDEVKGAERLIEEEKMKIITENNITYVILDNKITIALPKGTAIGVSSKNNDDEYNEEIGKALAFYRMKMDK